MNKEDELEDLVAHKVERRVAKKVLHDISQRVEEINHETDRQQHARSWLPLLVTVLIIGVFILVNRPALLQWISERLN